jgi:hypothetical protein
MNLVRLPMLCCVFMTTFAFAQTSETWQELKSEKGVSLSYQIADCQGNNFLFLKVENSTNAMTSAAYSIQVRDENGKILFVLPSRPHNLQADKTEVGDCEHATSEYSKPLPKAGSYKVELINLTVR